MFTRLIAKLLIMALAILAVAEVLGGVTVDSFYIATIVAVILGFINVLIRPVLILLTLPINIITLGLFTFVINGVLLWFVASFVQGFAVDGFLTAILAAFIIAAINWFGEKFISRTE